MISTNPLHRNLFCALPILLMTLAAGCDQAAESRSPTIASSNDEAALRQTVDFMTDALIARDYETVWNTSASVSKAKLTKQLRDFQNLDQESAAYQMLAPMMKQTFDLNLADLKNMDAKQYSVALMEGLDRAQQELRQQQIEKTKQRKIVRIEFFDYYAIVHSATPDGETLATGFFKEGDEWKCELEVADGITTSVELTTAVDADSI